MSLMSSGRQVVAGAILSLVAGCASAPKEQQPDPTIANPPPASGPAGPGVKSEPASASGAPDLAAATVGGVEKKPTQASPMTAAQRDEILKTYSDLPATAVAKLTDAEKFRHAETLERFVAANRELGLAEKTGGKESSAFLGAQERARAASAELNLFYRDILIAHPGLLATDKPSSVVASKPAEKPAEAPGATRPADRAGRGPTVGELLARRGQERASTPIAGSGAATSAAAKPEAAPKTSLESQISEAEGRAILAKFVSEGRIATAQASEAEQLAALRSDEGRALLLDRIRQANEQRQNFIAELNRQRLDGLRDLGQRAAEARESAGNYERNRWYTNADAAQRDMDLERQRAEMWGNGLGQLGYLGYLVFGGNNNAQQQGLRSATAEYNGRTREAGDFWENRARQSSDDLLRAYGDMEVSLRSDAAEVRALNELLGAAQARELLILQGRQRAEIQK